MTDRVRRRHRPTAPKPVRQVARAAGLSLRKLAEAVHAGQPSPPTPPAHTALLRWLAQSTTIANPGISEDVLAEQVAARLREMAEAGDKTAEAVMDAPLNVFLLAMARTTIALEGAPWVPEAPTVPKQQRMDSIAATVLERTGWTSVTNEAVEVIYRWLFGDEALFVAGMEMRLEAGLQMLENPALREVHVPHPDTGEFMVVTRQEIREHGEADHRVLEAAERYFERQVAWHGRLLRALRPYGDDSTSVGDAFRRAAADIGIDPAGRSLEDLAELVVAAEAGDGEAAG